LRTPFIVKYLCYTKGMSDKLITLDLSTKSTGYAIFDLDTGALITYGLLKPTVKGLSALSYPQGSLKRIVSICSQITTLLEENPDIKQIAIEEVNQHRSRIGGKTLDGLHFVLLEKIQDKLPIITFRDSDGAVGWRRELGLRLSDEDKAFNKEMRAQGKKKEVLGPKHLACRFVKENYGLDFDPIKENDLADAICLGHLMVAKHQESCNNQRA